MATSIISYEKHVLWLLNATTFQRKLSINSGLELKKDREKCKFTMADEKNPILL